MKKDKGEKVDKILEKILATGSTEVNPELKEKQAERAKLTEDRVDIIEQVTQIKVQSLVAVKRHAKGLLDSIERELSFYQPKCHKCYKEHGWLSKCKCLNDQTT
jgi:hypothetical protein